MNQQRGLSLSNKQTFKKKQKGLHKSHSTGVLGTSVGCSALSLGWLQRNSPCLCGWHFTLKGHTLTSEVHQTAELPNPFPKRKAFRFLLVRQVVGGYCGGPLPQRKSQNKLNWVLYRDTTWAPTELGFGDTLKEPRAGLGDWDVGQQIWGLGPGPYQSNGLHRTQTA